MYGATGEAEDAPPSGSLSTNDVETAVGDMAEKAGEKAREMQQTLQDNLTPEQKEQLDQALKNADAAAQQAKQKAEALMSDAKSAIAKNLTAEQQEQIDQAMEAADAAAQQAKEKAEALMEDAKGAIAKNLSDEQKAQLDQAMKSGEEMARQASQSAQEFLDDITDEKFLKDLQSDPLGTLRSMADDLDSEDPQKVMDSKLSQIQNMMNKAQVMAARAAAAKSVIESRLRKTKGEVMKVLLKQGECGIKDVTTIYSSDIEDLKEETEGADAAIGLLGPIFLTFLRKTNLVGLLLLPPMLIAIGICLVFDWSMSCDGVGIAVPIRLWFKIKMSADVLNFFFRLYIECKYRGYRNHADAVDEIEAKHEELEAAKQDRMDEDGLMDSMQSVAIMKRATAKLKQSAASGLVALQAYDDITRSWTYFFFQLWFPVSFGWDTYGFVLALEVVNKPCNSTALADFLYYFAFIYLVFLIFNTIWLLLWIFGRLLQSDWFANKIRDRAKIFDEEVALGMPVTQLIFDKVVQRDSDATAAKASAAMKMTYMQEREVIQAEMEAKLKEVDQKIEKMDTLMRWTGDGSEDENVTEEGQEPKYNDTYHVTPAESEDEPLLPKAAAADSLQNSSRPWFLGGN